VGSILKKAGIFLFLAVLLLRAGGVAAIEIGAKQVILIEFETGAVLYQKAADEVMFPASMTKMMTAYLLFERLKSGTLSLEDTFRVSEEGWRKGGSKMFVEVGDRVTVEDLIRGIVVQSGNDATIVVAEGLAGSERAFADLMTAKARALGMSQTTFRNASGWPDPEHVTSARDLATLAMATIREFPDYYLYYSELTFTYNNIKQGNRNPLLYKDIGADGLKTGHTVASGYGLTASAIRDGRRLIMVANGFESVKARSAGSERLIDSGFRDWNNYALFKAGEKVLDAQIWLGEAETVPLIIEAPLTVTVPRNSRSKLRVSVSFDEPVPAPITAGARIAELKIAAPGIATITIPLLAGADVNRLGPIGRLGAALRQLVWGGGN
jgi:D-alanyl-D-alanine carboxypeptidase (penicillin-binding protein 5/6)